MPFEILLVPERLHAGVGCAFEWRIVFLVMFVEEIGLFERQPAFFTAKSMIVRRLGAKIGIRHLSVRFGRGKEKAIVDWERVVVGVECFFFSM